MCPRAMPVPEAPAVPEGPMALIERLPAELPAVTVTKTVTGLLHPASASEDGLGPLMLVIVLGAVPGAVPLAMLFWIESAGAVPAAGPDVPML